MADGFGYGGYAGAPSYPYWLYPHPPPAYNPAFLPAESYDQTRSGFDPMIPHGGGGSYHRSPSSGDYTVPPVPFSYFTRPVAGDVDEGGEDSSKEKVSSEGGYYPYPSMETSSSGGGGVYCHPWERRYYHPPTPPYSSATVSSLADMLMRNSQEPFYVPVPPSGVCSTATRSGFDLNRPGHYYSGYGTHESVSAPPPPVAPYFRVPSMPMPSFETEVFSDGVRVGDGRSVGDDVSSHAPENVRSGGASGEASGHVKPFSEVGSKGSRSPGSSQPLQSDAKSSLCQKRTTLVADCGKGVSESSLKNAIGDLNFDEKHESWNQFVASSEGLSANMGSESCGAVKADDRNAVQTAVSSETHSEGSADQSSEDVQGETCKLQEQFDKKSTLLTDLGSIKGSRSPVCDQGDLTSPASSTRVSIVVKAMHNLSETLVYECFGNGSLVVKPEQLENLEKVVENLTKCLKKITGSKTMEGEASVPTQPIHVSSPDVVDLNEAPNVVAKDCQGFSVKPLDSSGFKESVDKDKNEMTQSIKNILASNFPDGEENHPQTLLYKNLWLETEAALCSKTCLSRYHRIQKETGNLKLQNTEISADASTFKQEPFLNLQKSVSTLNKAEQETAEPLIEHGSTSGNNVVTTSHDAPQSSRFNSAPLEAALSRMSISDVMGRFQMLKRRETDEQVQKSLNSVDFDSDSDSDFESDSDSDQPRDKAQKCDYLLSGSMMTIGGNSQLETCVNTEPSAYEKGYECPTSDWEYVVKDD